MSVHPISPSMSSPSRMRSRSLGPLLTAGCSGSDCRLVPATLGAAAAVGVALGAGVAMSVSGTPGSGAPPTPLTAEPLLSAAGLEDGASELKLDGDETGWLLSTGAPPGDHLAGSAPSTKMSVAGLTFSNCRSKLGGG